ncbi:MAG: tRNA (adenosine(37)-N6)-threonylcarbamoyltransferase complex ATPase subunit type 1 TsaE [bacterium]|nr:tRNA (adenosine(37)-N6)-threonylcarbamoyltransferase complex ATPase subunit type 1 TsaE [bacterium]
MKIVSQKLSDTHKLAGKIATAILKSGPHRNHARVVALVGDLGAGKTAFAQGFAKALGIKRHLPSPTFLIFRNYKLNVKSKKGNGFENLYHVDAYRIDDIGELDVLDFSSIIHSPLNIILVEWADKIKTILPKDSIWISFWHGAKETERVIDY